ncbi:MAG: prohibitin family protein [Oscillospiraceae bacterium]|jgi:regulator of protease activity HflC (stomatin/prohibitin superfamily)|nr:prohibitin family protein [Oscillospiraceae bacterium]
MGIRVFVGAVFVLIAIGAGVMAYKSPKKNVRRGMIAAAAVSVLLLLIVPGSLFTVSTGEIGVVKVFGEARETVTPGMNFKPWFSHTVEIYDIKTRQITIDFAAYSKDAQTVTGNLAVQYQIAPDEVLDISREFGVVEVLEERLKAIINERAKSVFSDKGAMLIVESRSSLSGEIEQRIVSALDQYHVTVTAVALADISFNEAFESAVEQKMVAEQEKLRAEYDKERAIIKAEEQLEVAQREADAVVEKAQGDAEALRIMQTAWSALSAEVKEAMLRQTFYEKWDGVLPGVMSGDSLDLIIGSSGVYAPQQNAPATPVVPAE